MNNGTQLDAWLFACIFLPIAIIAMVKIRQTIVTGESTEGGCRLQILLLIILICWAIFLVTTFGDSNVGF